MIIGKIILYTFVKFYRNIILSKIIYKYNFLLLKFKKKIKIFTNLFKTNY